MSEETGPDLDYVDFLNKRTLRTPVSDFLQLWGTVDLLLRLWPGNSLQLLFSQLLDGMRCPRGQLILEVSKIPEFLEMPVLGVTEWLLAWWGYCARLRVV